MTAEDWSVFDEFDAVVDAGIPSFKFFTAYDIGVSNGFLRLAFERLADLDAVAVLHTEDASVCQALTDKQRQDSRDSPPDYPDARPDYAEAMALSDAVALAEATDCKYYGIHTSSRAAAEELVAVQEDGSQFRGETCTHYATLTQDAYTEQGSLALSRRRFEPRTTLTRCSSTCETDRWVLFRRTMSPRHGRKRRSTTGGIVRSV